MSNAPARKFNPIFIATITPATVETKTSETKGDYTLMTGATVSKDGREDQTRTVMAFGAAHSEVAEALEAGKPVELAVQHNGGTLKVIGFPLAKAA